MVVISSAAHGTFRQAPTFDLGPKQWISFKSALLYDSRIRRGRLQDAVPPFVQITHDPAEPPNLTLYGRISIIRPYVNTALGHRSRDPTLMTQLQALGCWFLNVK